MKRNGSKTAKALIAMCSISDQIMQFKNKYVERNLDLQPINCRNKMMCNIHN
jgi:hypothetical protein